MTETTAPAETTIVDEPPAVVAHGNLAAALAAAQAEFGPLARDGKATVKTKSGPEYSYRYSTLANMFTVLRPALNRHGLSIHHYTSYTEGGRLMLTGRLEWSNGDVEQFRESKLFIDAHSSDPQAIGSYLTYARRYTTEALIGVAACDDDDGATAKAAAQDRNGAKQQRQQSGKKEQKAKQDPPPATGELDEAWSAWLKKICAKFDAKIADVGFTGVAAGLPAILGHESLKDRPDMRLHVLNEAAARCTCVGDAIFLAKQVAGLQQCKDDRNLLVGCLRTLVKLGDAKREAKAWPADLCDDLRGAIKEVYPSGGTPDEQAEFAF